MDFSISIKGTTPILIGMLPRLSLTGVVLTFTVLSSSLLTWDVFLFASGSLDIFSNILSSSPCKSFPSLAKFAPRHSILSDTPGSRVVSSVPFQVAHCQCRARQLMRWAVAQG